MRKGRDIQTRRKRKVGEIRKGMINEEGRRKEEIEIEVVMEELREQQARPFLLSIFLKSKNSMLREKEEYENKEENCTINLMKIIR